MLYESSTGIIRSCVVSPNTIGDMYSAAVAFWDNSVVTVENCVIKNFGRIGVYLNNATSLIRGNEIIGQIYSLDNQVIYGIEIEDYSGPSVAEITGNKIYNCNNTHSSPLWSSAAILVDGWREWADYYKLALLPSRVVITYNEIYDNYESMEIVANEFSYAHYNNFYNNAWGLVSAPENWTTNPTYYVFDARFNWWGHETGPYHETSWIYMGEPYGPNYGLGDKVSDYVLYDHWLEYPVPLPELTISVEPSSYQAKLRGEIFSVNITVSNLSVGWKTVAFQFRLCYNSTLLEVLNVTDGPFLKDPRWNLHGTYFIYFIEADSIHGSNIVVGLFLLPNATGQWTEFPSGSGTLATITFKAVYQHRGIEEPPLSCDLKLNSIIIENADAELVAHNLEHGHYEILPTNIGDVNHDGIVDVRDLSIIGRAFGSIPGHSRWNPEADVNFDEVIDIRDISKSARNFGWVRDPNP